LQRTLLHQDLAGIGTAMDCIFQACTYEKPAFVLGIQWISGDSTSFAEVFFDDDRSTWTKAVLGINDTLTFFGLS
jgi:hypothetical protein